MLLNKESKGRAADKLSEQSQLSPGMFQCTEHSIGQVTTEEMTLEEKS